MKNVLTLTALLISSLATGQNDPFWNPDANGDDLIGFADLASLLSVYNSSIGLDSSVICDFNGTDLEQFFLDLSSQSVVLDSVFFEYVGSGFIDEYTLGCPDPVQVPWSYSASGTCTNPTFSTYDDGGYEQISIQCQQSFPNGGEAYIYWYSYRNCPACQWELYNEIWASVQNPPVYGSYFVPIVYGPNVPTQYTNVIWDSLGIHLVEMDPSNFVRAIPYWHYAE